MSVSRRPSIPVNLRLNIILMHALRRPPQTPLIPTVNINDLAPYNLDYTAIIVAVCVFDIVNSSPASHSPASYPPSPTSPPDSEAYDVSNTNDDHRNNKTKNEASPSSNICTTRSSSMANTPDTVPILANDENDSEQPDMTIPIRTETTSVRFDVVPAKVINPEDVLKEGEDEQEKEETSTDGTHRKSRRIRRSSRHRCPTPFVHRTNSQRNIDEAHENGDLSTPETSPENVEKTIATPASRESDCISQTVDFTSCATASICETSNLLASPSALQMGGTEADDEELIESGIERNEKENQKKSESDLPKACASSTSSPPEGFETRSVSFVESREQSENASNSFRRRSAGRNLESDFAG